MFNISPPPQTLLGLFGDGTDGDIVLSSSGAVPTSVVGTAASKPIVQSGTTFTMGRDIVARSLTIPSGSTLNTGGYRLYVLGALSNQGTIKNNGGNGAGAIGANATFSGGTLGNGKGGAAGNVAAGSDSIDVANMVGAGSVLAPATIGTGGNGGTGAGGAGGTGGTATAPAAAEGNPHVLPQSTLGAVLGSSGYTRLQGGAGGAGGGGDGGSNKGGGGGGGAGVIVICARILQNDGDIQAKGGNGAAGTATNCGGGGGGMGGGILLTYQNKRGSGTTTVTGGSGGASGGGSGVAGAAGSAGTVIEVQI